MHLTKHDPRIALDLVQLRRLRDGLIRHLNLLAYLDRWSFDHIPAHESLDELALVEQLEQLVGDPALAEVVDAARQYVVAIYDGVAAAPETALQSLVLRRFDVQAAADRTVAAAALSLAMHPAGTTLAIA